MSSSPAPLPPASSAPRKNRRIRLIVLISLSALAIGVVLLNIGKGAYQSYELASDAAQHFHWQLDSADYDGIYRDASDEFRRSGRPDDARRFLETVHQKMGKSAKNSTAGLHVIWKGRWWISQVLDTQFALGQGRESFIWVQERDRFRLYGYHIDSQNLH
jgi:hypothetical protein